MDLQNYFLAFNFHSIWKQLGIQANERLGECIFATKKLPDKFDNSIEIALVSYLSSATKKISFFFKRKALTIRYNNLFLSQFRDWWRAENISDQKVHLFFEKSIWEPLRNIRPKKRCQSEQGLVHVWKSSGCLNFLHVPV